MLKKALGVGVLALALVATMGSADDEDSGDGGGTTTTVSSSGGSEATDGGEGEETTAPAEGGETTAPAGDNGDAGEADEVDDVVITACAEGDFGYASATIEVTNNSSEASNYLIEIAFESADGSTQIGTGYASVNSLAPGQKTTQEAGGLDEVSGQEFTCRVSSVERYAA